MRYTKNPPGTVDILLLFGRIQEILNEAAVDHPKIRGMVALPPAFKDFYYLQPHVRHLHSPTCGHPQWKWNEERKAVRAVRKRISLYPLESLPPESETALRKEVARLRGEPLNTPKPRS